MIRYNLRRWYGLGIILSRKGSVLHKCLPQALIATIVCALCKAFWTVDPDVLGNKYAHQVLAYVLAYLLVFRSTFSYNRFWEARGWLTYMLSKMGDLMYQTKFFSVQDAGSHAPFAKRLQHLYLLWVATMLQECIRQTDSTGCSYAGSIDLFSGDEILQGDEFAEERRILSSAPNRPLVVMSWISETWVKRQHDRPSLSQPEGPPVRKGSGIRVAPPVLARTYQQMSEIMLAYNSLMKIACCPVPFPYCQMSVIVLTLFGLLWPVVAAAMINWSFWSCVMSFLVTLGFYAVDAIATELSDPFGDDANDLPLTELMNQFKAECDFMRIDLANTKTAAEILDPPADAAFHVPEVGLLQVEDDDAEDPVQEDASETAISRNDA